MFKINIDGLENRFDGLEQQIANIAKQLLEKPKDEADDLMGIDEAAQFLGLSKAAIYAHKRNGIPCFTRCNKLYFLKKELIEWIKGSRAENKQAQLMPIAAPAMAVKPLFPHQAKKYFSTQKL